MAQQKEPVVFMMRPRKQPDNFYINEKRTGCYFDIYLEFAIILADGSIED